jgi:hypothetical protein
MSLMSVECCQVEVSATRSLVKGRTVEYGQPEYDREAPIVRPTPNSDCCAMHF